MCPFKKTEEEKTWQTTVMAMPRHAPHLLHIDTRRMISGLFQLSMPKLHGEIVTSVRITH
jgi:hypothetical protein